MLLIRRTPAVKNLQAHRTTVHRALGALFESPIDIDDKVSRAVLRSVLGPGERNFKEKAIDFSDNQHLAVLVKPAVLPVIWVSESKLSRKTVLNPIDNQGQQLLVDWIGAYSILPLSVLLIYFLYGVPFSREFVPRRRPAQHRSADYSRESGIRALQHPMVLSFLQTDGREEGRQGKRF